MHKDSTLYGLLIFLFIILSPIQDFYLSNYGLGIFGASPSFIPLTLLIIIGLFNGKYKKINLFALVFFLYFATVFIANYFIYINSLEIENSAFKSIKVFILYFYFLYPIFFLKYDHSITRYALFVAFGISMFGLLASTLYPEFIDANQYIHADSQTNSRPRGFATESTTLAIQVMTLGSLCAIFSKSKFAQIILLICILFSQIIIESKGGIAAISLSIFISTLFFFKTSIKTKILLVAFSILIIFTAYNFLFSFFADDFNYYTSSATRLVMALTTFLIIENHPFGVGVSGYLQEINNNIPSAIKLINFPLNFEEVYSYMNADSYRNISAKSLFFNGCIYVGIPFLIGYIYFFIVLIHKIIMTRKLLLTILSVFCFIALTFYADGVGAYSLSISLGIALGINRKMDSECPVEIR